MAERATGDRVAADMQPPNYRGAVQKLRGIKPKKEKIGSVNGEIADIYAKVESLKVNKKGARIFLTLDALEATDRADIWRSLVGLIDAAGWDDATDLVDKAEGYTIVDFPGRKQAAPAAGENDAGEDIAIDGAMKEVEAEVAADAAAKPKRRSAAVTAAEARDRVREHFGEGKVPPPAGSTEPYTGDNSDLNPE